MLANSAINFFLLNEHVKVTLGTLLSLYQWFGTLT
jgi:hypothetical protein